MSLLVGSSMSDAAVSRAPAEGRAAHLFASSRAVLTLPVLTVLAVHVAARALAFWSSPTVTYPETATLMEIGAAPVTSPAWWGLGGEPFTVPMAYRLAGLSVGGAVFLQWALALLAWSVLAVVAARLVRTPRLQPVAAALVIVFGLSREVSQWERVALGESVALSLLALLVAALIVYATSPGRRALLAVLVLAALLAFARDIDANVVLLVGVGLAGAAVLARGRRLLHLMGALGCLAIFAASVASVSAGQRWEYPFYNVLSIRILPDAGATGSFVAAGMPMSDALRERAGKGGGDNVAYLQDPRLATVRAWVLASGRATYVAYLATHPDVSVLQPGSNLFRLLAEGGAISDAAPRAAAPLGDAVSAWAFPDRDAVVLLLGALAGLAVATALVAGPRREWLVPTLLIAAAVPLAMVVYHAEVGDLGPAELLPNVLVRLGAWVLLAALLDSLVAARTTPRSQASRPPVQYQVEIY